MLFNSYPFLLLFLPITLVGFFSISKHSRPLGALWLVMASLFFYGWWNPEFVWLLLASIGCNYALGRGIARAPNRGIARALLIASITVNLAVLAFYKYTNFFIDTATILTGRTLPLWDIVLPLGISFFTFTQIAFLVDVHRGLAREYNFIHYLLFVTYFPHLIAGPVLHHSQMMPQFAEDDTYRLQAGNIAIGFTVLTLGLAKKVLIADNLSIYSASVFDAARDGAPPKLIAAWIGALAYTLQLYFDFSGYSDMAVGVSRMFGVRLPFNFNSPYKATSIIEFWRRWHMTLSQFLRDYLYVPLGGSRRGEARRYFNLFVTMLLGGLWHGANWTFVIWGGIHGLYLAINHGWNHFRERSGRELNVAGPLAHFGATAVTFFAIVIAWVVFRAANLETAVSMLKGMAGINGVSLPQRLGQFIGGSADTLNAWGMHFDGSFPEIAHRGATMGQFASLALVGFVIIWGLPNTQQWVGLVARENSPSVSGTAAGFGLLMWRPTPKLACALGLVFAVCLMSLTKLTEFLYYQF